MIEVRREVLAATDGAQVPWDQSSLTGKFYFAPKHDAGSIGNSDTAAAEPVAADYQSAERVGTREAWQAFLARHGNSKDNFHVQLARAALQKLAVGILPDQRQPSAEPAEEVLPPPLSDPSRCRAANFAGIGARVCASSVLKPHQNIDYDPGNLSDDRPDTAWVEGGKDNGEGQYLVLDFDAPLLIRELTLANGYGKNDDIFAKNGRVERLDIVFSSGERRTVKLSDTPSWQSVAIDPPVKARWLQLIIGSVYSGWKYSDTAVSGLKPDSRARELTRAAGGRHQDLCAIAAVAAAALTGPSAASELPEGLVYLADIAPDIRQDIRYATADNFTGAVVPGYGAGECLLARAAANALKAVQHDLARRNLSLLVYDCYRPTRAVTAFMQWARQGDGPGPYHPLFRREELSPAAILPACPVTAAALPSILL